MAKGKRVFELIHPNAAGIDIGAATHFVAAPPDRDDEPVRELASFTEDLHRLADGLTACGADTVAMEWYALVIDRRACRHLGEDWSRLEPQRPATRWKVCAYAASPTCKEAIGLGARTFILMRLGVESRRGFLLVGIPNLQHTRRYAEEEASISIKGLQSTRLRPRRPSFCGVAHRWRCVVFRSPSVGGRLKQDVGRSTSEQE